MAGLPTCCTGMTGFRTKIAIAVQYSNIASINAYGLVFASRRLCTIHHFQPSLRWQALLLQQVLQGSFTAAGSVR
jgi:hypothetical protein